MSDSSSEEERPILSEHPDFADLKPVFPADLDKNVPARIKYSSQFVESHGYLHAVMHAKEISERALTITQYVIDDNAANYTAWHYRRVVVEGLSRSARQEMAWILSMAEDNPKNYQIWQHRRWCMERLIIELDGPSENPLEHPASSTSEADCGNQDAAATGAPWQVAVRTELELLEAFLLNPDMEDAKNYHAWSHRQWLVKRSGMWEQEHAFVDRILQSDFLNNSGWNHKWFILWKGDVCQGPLPKDVGTRAIDWALQLILKHPQANESAWSFLLGCVGGAQGVIRVPEIEKVSLSIVEAPGGKESLDSRFAMEWLAYCAQARGETEQAKNWYSLLANVDKIRSEYWKSEADTLSV